MRASEGENDNDTKVWKDAENETSIWYVYVSLGS